MKVKAKAAKGNETKKQNKAAFFVFHGPLNFTKLTSIHFGLVLVLQLQELLSLFWFREGHKTATADSNPFSPALKAMLFLSYHRSKVLVKTNFGARYEFQDFPLITTVKTSFNYKA